jgi:aminopeptidase
VPVAYAPPQEILDRYASVLVEFALGGGDGIKPGEVVRVVAPESAKPLYAALNRAVWRVGGHVLGGYQPDDDQAVNLARDFFELAGDAQLEHFPAQYTRGLVDEMDHQVTVIAPSDPRSLDKVDPARIMRRGEAMRPLLDWRGEKENAGRFTWTLGLYGTPGMAAEAGMSVEEYWEQIVHACFLDSDEPLARWREVGERLEETRRWLDSLQIERLHVEGEDADLWVKVGERRRWLGGRGRNIPSFELFTSPDWRGTEGWIYCNQPLYRYGSLVKGIRLTFADGRVTAASAEENERVLTEMIATEGADKVGEFSLTDRRRERRRHLRQHPHRPRALLPRRLRRRSRAPRPGGLAAARLQQLERAHRHRLHHRSRRHRHAS